MENTIKFFWNGIKVNGKLNKFHFSQNGDHVSFYEDGYGSSEMPKECGIVVINNSEPMTDYFERDHGSVPKDHPLYKFFVNAARLSDIHYRKKHIQWCERRIARYEKGMALHPGYEAEYIKTIESYREDIKKDELLIAELEKAENPGQPTEEDFKKVAEYIAALKEKAAKEKAEQEAKEEAARAEAHERTEKFVNETVKKHSEAFPYVEGAPFVKIGFSEMYGLPGWPGDKPLILSVKAADRIFGELDIWQHTIREAPGHYFGWYHKTDFEIKWKEDGEECCYQGRYDIGDGEGGLLNHIRNFGEWKRTHGEFGGDLENPPETNEVLEMVKKFEAFAA